MIFLSRPKPRNGYRTGHLHLHGPVCAGFDEPPTWDRKEANIASFARVGAVRLAEWASGHMPQRQTADLDAPIDRCVVVERVLSSGMAELLEALLAACPAQAVSTLARVSHAWAMAAEISMRAVCARHDWRLPRRPRQRSAAGTLGVMLPWRACFIAHICKGCQTQPGDFAVRSDSKGSPSCYLCRECAKATHIVERLRRANATLDVTGLSGKPLYTRTQSKFCSEVSKLSKESIDHASGQRADVVRRSGAVRR